MFSPVKTDNAGEPKAVKSHITHFVNEDVVLEW